ncbi:uracil-DNA glycosylase [Arsenophonus endosymbiont of Lipoptena cervi]|uniref:uracil-DNA glycosylase n=1 Tax=Arsenophonus endosymbiont of Lipoptena cervi TaxID=363258 RepID=UPI00376EBE6F
MKILTTKWHEVIGLEKNQDYFLNILSYIAKERRQGKVIFPAQKDIFNAFRYTKFNEIKVVILGQDPYHGYRQAHGLSFSVLPNVAIPPSLINIYKELAQDILDFRYPNHGCLVSWAQQGVLLLNTCLTVEFGKAHSHAHLGWEIFTDKVIKKINKYHTGIVFLLWGAHAQKKGQFIDKRKHFILKASHPSPFSVHKGFFGCRHFSEANKILVKQKISPINWTPII